MKRTKLLAAIVFAFLLSAVTMPAYARRGVNIPLQVRITTYVNEKMEGIKPDFEWVVSYDGKEYTLYILNLVSMDGRTTSIDIDNAVNRFKPNFRITGQSSEIQKLIDTPPRQQIVITAYLNFAGGARLMMINTVEAPPEPTVAPTP